MYEFIHFLKITKRSLHPTFFLFMTSIRYLLKSVSRFFDTKVS